MTALPTRDEVIAALDSLEPMMTGPNGRRLYDFVKVKHALFPKGDPRLQKPRTGYSPAYRFMLDLELGKAVPGISGGGSGLWRDANVQ